jgi:hypothetical protein
MPQAWQVKRGSMSDSRASSGHWSPLIAVQWLHWVPAWAIKARAWADGQLGERPVTPLPQHQINFLYVCEAGEPLKLSIKGFDQG